MIVRRIARGLAIGVALLAPPAVSVGLGSPNGTWAGSYSEGGRQPAPVPVDLQLRAGVPGATAGRIRFGPPWVCGFDLSYRGEEAGGHVYFLAGDGPGACAKFNQGLVRLALFAENAQLQIVGADGRLRATVALTSQSGTRR
jgi:hypothetical protein